MEEEINRLLDQYREIPPMPHVMVKALEVIKNPKSGARELGDIMSVDQAMSAKVLSLVNSAFYGFRQQITSVNKAIVILGMMRAKNIVMSLALKPMMSGHGSRELWEHSIKCAVAAEYLAGQYRVINPDDAFVIGFMHDIGKMLMASKDPVKYSKIKYIAQQDPNQDINALEKSILGVNHCELGAMISKRWSLPVVLTNCIKYHHTPWLSSLPSACGVIYLADRLVQVNPPEVFMDEALAEKLNLKVTDPQALREQVLSKSAILLRELSTQ